MSCWLTVIGIGEDGLAGLGKMPTTRLSMPTSFSAEYVIWLFSMMRPKPNVFYGRLRSTMHFR